MTGECLGRSVWESRTNLLTYSEEFDNAAWTKTNASILSNQVIAPDGTLTGDKLVESLDVGQTEHRVSGAATTTAVSTTFTVFAKKAERNWMYLRFINSAGTAQRAWFNLDTGVVGARDSGTSTIQNIGNGWYRCSFTLTAFAGANALRVYTATADSDLDYTGDGYSGIYIWGAQLELGSFATPYIPTVASQVTRVADSAVMTGVNFSSWYRADEGTLVLEGAAAGSSGALITIAEGALSTNRILITLPTPSISGNILFAAVNGTTQASLSGTPTTSTANKVAGSYAVNDYKVCLNGGTVGTDTAALVPVVDNLRLGQTVGTTFSGYYRRVTYYNRSLTSAELQAITR